MLNRIRQYFRGNRFLVYLLTVCVIFASVLFLFSRDSQSTWEDNLRSLASNLSAEIIGAAISVFFIDWLLKKHQGQARKGTMLRIQERVFSLGYTTIVRTIGRIPQPEFDSIDSFASIELFEVVGKRDISSALSILDKVFLTPSSVHPIVYSLMCSVTSQLLQDWNAIFDQFRDYFTSEQIEGILDIINCLKQIISSSQSMAMIVKEFDIEKDLPNVNKMASSGASEKLVGSVKELCGRTLNVLSLVQ